MGKGKVGREGGKRNDKRGGTKEEKGRRRRKVGSLDSKVCETSVSTNFEQISSPPFSHAVNEHTTTSVSVS